MRPKITCHMITSLDGRLHPGRWSDPVGDTINHLVTQHYDATAETFDADGWIVGRKSMAEYLGEYDAPELLASPRSRSPHIVERDGRQLAIVIDPSGRIAFDSGLVDGEQAVSILSERVSDETLSQLREKGVAYVFAGADGHDLGLALDWLGQMMDVRHLLLEGGGATNGAFLAAGLIDEVSTLICPALDGLSGVPAIFEHHGPPGSHPAASQHLRLHDCKVLEGGVVWLLHEVHHARKE